MLIAPAEALATVAVARAERLFGKIIPWAPKASTFLIIAPRLCGSSISSKSTTKGASPFSLAKAKISSTSAYFISARLAQMPW